MPYVVVVEGTRDVSTVCAELMVKLNHSLAFEGVTWVHRTEDEPAGLESERSKALMRGVNRYEFDVSLRRRLESVKDKRHVFILSGYYDVGFWRRVSEVPLAPNLVFYVEFEKPTDDPRHASFVRFVRGLGLKDVRFVRYDLDMTVPSMIGACLDLLNSPDCASV